MKFNEKLQMLRKEHKLSQEQLADMLDVSRQSVSKWESGQTYPEMDKLITMCKIFKCSLDDLTNDEVKTINSVDKKNVVSSFFDEALDMINKTVSMLRHKKLNDLSKMFVELLLVFLFLLFCHIPFDYIYQLGNQIFQNFGTTIGNLMSSIWNFLLQISYLVIAVIVFVYFYKVRFLDRYDEELLEGKKIEKIIEDNEISDNVERKAFVSEHKQHSYVFFHILGGIAVGFLKCMMILVGIPFAIALFFLGAAFIFNIILVIKGVFYLGVFFLILFGILFVCLILEIIFNFVFNRKMSTKRFLITFLVSLLGLGMGFGITFIDVTSFSYLNSLPEDMKMVSIQEEYSFAKDFNVNSLYYSSDNIKYVEDDHYRDKVKISMEYYDFYASYELSNDNNYIHLNKQQKNIMMNKIVDYILKDLAHKKIHNYELLYQNNIVITSSKENIKVMKDNYQKFLEQQQEEQRNQEYKVYQNQIDELQELIHQKEQEFSIMNQENEELKQSLEIYKSKLDQYRQELDQLLRN